MARTEEENTAITDKIAYLVNIEGLRPDRATAAAFRMFREGELEIPKPQPKIPQSNEVEEEFRREQRRSKSKLRRKQKQIQKQFIQALQSLLQ